MHLLRVNKTGEPGPVESILPSTCGLHGTKEYMIWATMRQRVNNPKNKKYKDYGARGIDICPEWDSFLQFYTDMGPKPDGYSLDRIDNDKGYSKENCKWSTPKEQANNRRPHKNKTGFPGVTEAGQRFKAQIWAGGEYYNLGIYDTPEEAHTIFTIAKEIRKLAF